MKEMMLYSFCWGGWKQHWPLAVTMNLSPRTRLPSLSVRTYDG